MANFTDESSGFMISTRLIVKRYEKKKIRTTDPTDQTYVTTKKYNILKYNSISIIELPSLNILWETPTWKLPSKISPKEQQ